MQRKVVFVCEHGAAKSVVAAAYFNKLADEKKLDIHAVARGTNPDEELASSAIKGLAKDGLKVEEKKPTLLTKQETNNAMAMISFCDLPDEYQNLVPIESWLDVPPVSVDYEKARAILLAHIHTFFDEMKKES